MHNSLLVNDNLIAAAVVLQDITAAALCDDSVQFYSLSDEQQDDLFMRVVNYAAHRESIQSAEQLHQFNSQKFGWYAGKYGSAEKRSPMLCDFAELPSAVQVFIRSMYAVLNCLVFSQNQPRRVL